MRRVATGMMKRPILRLLNMRWIPGDVGWCGYEGMKRGEQGSGGVQAVLRGASAGVALVKEKGNVRPRGFFYALRDREGDVSPPEASQSLRSGRPCAEVPVRGTPLNEGKQHQTALIVLG